MAGLRGPGGRTRGSWIPRLAGIGLVVLPAVAGAAVYLAHANAPRSSGARSHPASTPTVQARVLSTQPAGIADPGPPGRDGARATPELLLDSAAGLRFSPASESRPPPGYPEWTVDQMQDGSYTIIYISTGRCLAASAGSAAGVLLQRCDLSIRQRWLRQFQDHGAASHSFWLMRNAATGRCLTAGAALAAGRSAARPAQLQSCARSPGWQQLITFWSPP
jgi:hypothetical protein